MDVNEPKEENALLIIQQATQASVAAYITLQPRVLLPRLPVPILTHTVFKLSFNHGGQRAKVGKMIDSLSSSAHK